MSSVSITPECPANDSAQQESVSSDRLDPLELTIELGQTTLTLDEVRQLRPGAMVSLDEYLNDPVTIFAGTKLVGRGEVLLVEGQLAVRITELYCADSR